MLAIRKLKNLGHYGFQVSRPPRELTRTPHQKQGPPVHFPGLATPAPSTASSFLSRKALCQAYPLYHAPDTDWPSLMPPPMPPLYFKGLCTESPRCSCTPSFTPRVSGGLGPPPNPSPIIEITSNDNADILHHLSHTVLVHKTPELGSKMEPCLKPWQHPGPGAKSSAIRREKGRRLLEEEISTEKQVNMPANTVRRP